MVGGIIPDADAQALRAEGVAAVYTPKDFAINRLIGDIVKLVDADGRRLSGRSGFRRR